MNRISARQLYFFLACIAPVGKLVILPARLSANAGNDLLFPAAAQLLLQAAAIFCVLLLAKREKGLYDLLAEAMGAVIAKIVMCVLSLFLLFAALLPLLEQQLFVQGVFYDTLPSVVAFAPFFIFSAYLCAKPLFSHGRLFDILGPIAVVGLCGVLLFSVTGADYGALLPAGSAGWKGFLKSAAFSFPWFYDSVLVLFLLGKIEYRKGIAYKGALFYLLGEAGVLLFLATFYGIFEGLAPNQLFAFSKTSKYYTAITVLGRVDYLFIFALSLVMAFYCALPVHAAVDGAVDAFGRKKYLPSLLSLALNALFFALTIVFDYRFGVIMQFISETLFWIFPLFVLLVPLLCLILRRTHESA